jgi:hypothetical protein
MPSLILNVKEATEMANAIDEGRATLLLPCYMCKGEPLRGVVDDGGKVLSMFAPSRKLYVMTCGHTIT